MFTRQHYQAIAKAISRLPNNQDKGMVVSDLINLFEADNPRFDANRFSNACYDSFSQRIEQAGAEAMKAAFGTVTV